MITHITVEDAAKLISRIAGTNETHALTYIREAADRGEIQTADALTELQAEHDEIEKHLNEFSEFLCHMTGGLLSKTNYTAQEMISAAEDYQQRVCDNDCELRADLARVTAERDAAIEDLEEIMFKGGHNIDTCHFCANGQCYGRGGTQVCNPLWRGIKED